MSAKSTDWKALEHDLVPEHEILDDQEVERILAKFNITKQQLPKIFVTDTVIKEIDGTIGDVVKITRDSPTAGETVYYRVVVRE